MTTMQIKRFRATWSIANNAGVIEISVEPGKVRKLAFKTAADFTAVYTMLQMDPEISLVDDDMISTDVQPTGVKPLP